MKRFCLCLLPAICGMLFTAVRSWGAPAPATNNNNFADIVSAQFFNWDTNHDQTLSMAELDAAIEDPGNTGAAAAALAALKRASRATNFALPLLTVANIRELAASPPATNRPNLPRLYGESLKRISGVTHRELFASGLPQLDTIHQGRMGDCFCLAPLGAMIHRSPNEVAALFSVLADGNVRVQFGGGPVVVPPPTDAELAMTAGNAHDGVWLNLYEKAISVVRNEQKPPDKRSDLAIDAIATGGSAGKILAYLTGHKVTGFSCKFATNSATPPAQRESRLAKLREKLAAATQQKCLMVCGTQKPATPGLTPHHAYALLAYDPEADLVELWNPHGNTFAPKGPAGPAYGYPTRKGLFSVPLTEFITQFSGVTFEITPLVSRK
jgi:hypothetical protein